MVEFLLGKAGAIGVVEESLNLFSERFRYRLEPIQRGIQGG
jgi:hypothetical protein